MDLQQSAVQQAAAQRAAGEATPDRLSRRATWLAWALWATFVLLAALNLILANTRDQASFWLSVLGDLALLAYVTVGALIVTRRPGNRIGWILIAAALTLMVSIFAVDYATYALITRPGSLPGGELVEWVAAWSRNIGFFMMFTFLLLLFPDGSLPSRRWRPVAWMAAASIVLLSIIAAFLPGPLTFAPLLSNSPYAAKRTG